MKWQRTVPGGRNLASRLSVAVVAALLLAALFVTAGMASPAAAIDHPRVCPAVSDGVLGTLECYEQTNDTNFAKISEASPTDLGELRARVRELKTNLAFARWSVVDGLRLRSMIEHPRDWDRASVYIASLRSHVQTLRAALAHTRAQVQQARYAGPARAAGFVWNDRNANGLFDDGPGSGVPDDPLGGIRVSLSAGGSVLQVTTTDAAGTYHFDGLALAVPFNIEVDVQTIPVPPPWNPPERTNGGGPFDHAVSITFPVGGPSGSQVASDLDFGYRLFLE